MKELVIKYHKGQSSGTMTLQADFFPCKITTAKKIFKLAIQWCSDEQITELQNYLKSIRADAEQDRLTAHNEWIDVGTKIKELEYDLKYHIKYSEKRKEAEQRLRSLKRERRNKITINNRKSKIIELCTRNLEILSELKRK